MLLATIFVILFFLLIVKSFSQLEKIKIMIVQKTQQKKDWLKKNSTKKANILLLLTTFISIQAFSKFQKTFSSISFKLKNFFIT